MEGDTGTQVRNHLLLFLLLLISFTYTWFAYTYIFSQPITASVFLEGNFTLTDKGIVLKAAHRGSLSIEDEGYLSDNIEETCLSTCLNQLQPENDDSRPTEHQCGKRSGARGYNQR